MPMYGFIVCFAGIWRQGYAFVAARTPEEAAQIHANNVTLCKELANQTCDVYEVKEVCTLERGSQERFVLIDNGNE